MKPLAKLALIAAGYAVAGLVAGAVVAMHQAETARDAVGADGMYAFGDLLWFLAVFGCLALFPTFAAIRWVWLGKSRRAR